MSFHCMAVVARGCCVFWAWSQGRLHPFTTVRSQLKKLFPTARHIHLHVKEWPGKFRRHNEMHGGQVTRLPSCTATRRRPARWPCLARVNGAKISISIADSKEDRAVLAAGPGLHRVHRRAASEETADPLDSPLEPEVRAAFGHGGV
eukprot:GGOE01039098.1.p2 GENE.GGOE01039098.1~~GGOE01039098.1.p2  ORF type:complete len:147 (+),score=11.02 GGOE01039098.1:243-683(+)